jgi:hypothetical protein
MWRAVKPEVSRAQEPARFRSKVMHVRGRRGSKYALNLLAVIVLGTCSGPAFAQRGVGGFHGGVGTEFGRVGRNGSLPAVAGDPADSSISRENGSSSLAAGASRIAPPLYAAPGSTRASSASQSDSGSSDDILWRDSSAYPQEVTIGFPPPSAGNLSFSRGRVVEGQGAELWAEAPQRGAGAPHAGGPVGGAPAGRAPMGRPPVMRLPRPPITGGRFVPPPVHFVPPFRAVGPNAALRSFAFLRRPIGLPPPGRPVQPIFFGFVWFGYPFWAFVTPNCNPFWAWPWVYGCNSFGYWDGYGGFGPAFDGGVYGQDYEPESEQQSQEPETFTWVPPPESSPEEIEAEKPLTVLFLKNGAVYAVTDYWIQDNKLYYMTSYGGRNAIDLDDIDLQKTVDVNAKRGVEFILKPSPDQNPQNPPPPDQPTPPKATDPHM